MKISVDNLNEDKPTLLFKVTVNFFAVRLPSLKKKRDIAIYLALKKELFKEYISTPIVILPKLQKLDILRRRFFLCELHCKWAVQIINIFEIDIMGPVHLFILKDFNKNIRISNPSVGYNV